MTHRRHGGGGGGQKAETDTSHVTAPVTCLKTHFLKQGWNFPGTSRVSALSFSLFLFFRWEMKEETGSELWPLYLEVWPSLDRMRPDRV